MHILSHLVCTASHADTYNTSLLLHHAAEVTAPTEHTQADADAATAALGFATESDAAAAALNFSTGSEASSRPLNSLESFDQAVPFTHSTVSQAQRVADDAQQATPEPAQNWQHRSDLVEQPQPASLLSTAAHVQSQSQTSSADAGLLAHLAAAHTQVESLPQLRAAESGEALSVSTASSILEELDEAVESFISQEPSASSTDTSQSGAAFSELPLKDMPQPGAAVSALPSEAVPHSGLLASALPSDSGHLLTATSSRPLPTSVKQQPPKDGNSDASAELVMPQAASTLAEHSPVTAELRNAARSSPKEGAIYTKGNPQAELAARLVTPQLTLGLAVDTAEQPLSEVIDSAGGVAAHSEQHHAPGLLALAEAALAEAAAAEHNQQGDNARLTTALFLLCSVTSGKVSSSAMVGKC